MPSTRPQPTPLHTTPRHARMFEMLRHAQQGRYALERVDLRDARQDAEQDSMKNARAFQQRALRSLMMRDA